MNHEPILLDGVRGDSSGLVIPAHADALHAAGASFLTKAFRAYGSLSEDNRVTRISRFEPCMIGSTGQKTLLSVEYQRPEPGLPEDLFVKFSRDFGDAFRDRRRGELASEIALCELSRLGGFPIRVPVPYFFSEDEELSEVIVKFSALGKAQRKRLLGLLDGV